MVDLSFVQTPLVSVVVRTKDRQEYLASCIESIVEQDYRPIHVVVVNDGGESVQNVLSLYGDELLTVTLLELPDNAGRARAANLGLDVVQGEYISFLDDDDYWLPGHLSYLVSGLLGLESAKNLVFPEAAIYSATRAVLIEKGAEKEIKVYQAAFDKSRLLYNNFLPIHSVLFSRSVLDKGVRFDESFDLFEDWDFWLQVSCIVPFISLPNITGVYRLHKDGSGVHGKDLTQLAYQRIYDKWLVDCATSELSELLQKVRVWHSEDVEALQRVHQNKLDSIGALHSYAISVISDKDADIESLNATYNDALSVIAEKDQNIRSLEEAHRYAVSVVAEKDTVIDRLCEELSLLKAKADENRETVEQLKLDRSQSLATVKDKDLCIATLQKKNSDKTAEVLHLKTLLEGSPIKLLRFACQRIIGKRNK